MFSVLSAAQVMTSKIENRQPQIFCEQRGQLEKRDRRLNSLRLQGEGRQVFRCVYSLTLQ
jgi:hypothetical protein